MSNLNLNKAAAAILVAGLIGMVTGKVTDTLYYGSPEGAAESEKEMKRGYKIDVVEAPSDGSAAPSGPGDLSALYASADMKAGEDFVNKKCTTCHDVSKGGANKIGPHIYGVVNRTVASVGDFNYSSAMKGHAATAKSWTVDNLNAFLWGPGKTVPGTMMSFAGIPKDQERANVIAYLATKMTDSPAKLPTASAKPAAKTDAKDPKGAAKASPAEKGVGTSTQPAPRDGKGTATPGAQEGTIAKEAPVAEDTKPAGEKN